MTNKYSDLVIDEKELDKQIDSGKIKPVHIPQFASFSEIEKFQLCTEIIKYKKANNLKQKDIADVIDVNKSEVSKLFSYNLKEFSQERLLGFIELLIEHGAVIDMDARMNFNDLDPNEKLALLLFNKKTIGKMFDTFIGIMAYMLLFSVILIGIGIVLYQIKCALGINIFP